MDASLRELERRCAATPGDAALWAALARTCLRSAGPVPALAAVREGLAVAPADPALLSIRDEALPLFWSAPRFRRLHEREGATGRLTFSADGAFIASAGRGVVVYRTAGLELAGGGFAGESNLAVAFAGHDLLVGSAGQVARWSFEEGRVRSRLRIDGNVLAVAAAPSGARAIVVTEQHLIEFAVSAGTKPLRAVASRPHERRVQVAFAVARERVDDLLFLDRSHGLANGRHALTPDGVRCIVRVDGERATTFLVAQGVPDEQVLGGIASSPCGSRVAFSSASGTTPRLVLLEAIPN